MQDIVEQIEDPCVPRVSVWVYKKMVSAVGARICKPEAEELRGAV